MNSYICNVFNCLQDFSKLLAMAEASDGKSAHIGASDLIPKKKEDKEDKENVYTVLTEKTDLLYLPFGKGVTSALG